MVTNTTVHRQRTIFPDGNLSTTNSKNVTIEMPERLLTGRKMSPSSHQQKLNKVVHHIGHVVVDTQKRYNGEVPTKVIVKMDERVKSTAWKQNVLGLHCSLSLSLSLLSTIKHFQSSFSFVSHPLKLRISSAFLSRLISNKQMRYNQWRIFIRFGKWNSFDNCSSERNRAADSFVDLGRHVHVCVGLARGLTN